MSSLEALTGSPYLSFSSLESWLTCGEKYRLEKVVGVAQTPAWYLLGGSAVHKATELLDIGDTDNPTAAWNQAWAEQLETITDHSQVKAGGRASKAWPNKENKDWWDLHGPVMVGDWHLMLTARKSQGWQVLAVEAAFNLDLDGVLIRGYIDRVMVNPNAEAEVWDIKAGSHVPAGKLQLGVYGLGAEQALGVKPILGRYYMARKAELTEPASLLAYTADRLTDWFGKARQAIEAEVFIPHVQSLCSACSVAPFCVAVGGTPHHSDNK